MKLETLKTMNLTTIAGVTSWPFTAVTMRNMTKSENESAMP